MDTRWQATRSTAKERNQYMYNNKLFSDVEFSVACSRSFTSGCKTMKVPGHKYVLATSSPVFAAMFYGGLSETSRTISLPDCTAEGLLELFRFIYCEEIELTLYNVMEILYLAQKYFVPFLVEKCHQFIGGELQPQDALDVLDQAVKLGDQQLKKLCWDTIDSHAQEVLLSDSFLFLTKDKLRDMLSRDTLNITEAQLFEGINRWLECQVDYDLGKQKRSVLGDEVVQLIRFPLMTKEEFCQAVLPSKILNIDEISELLAFYSSEGNTTLKFFRAKQRAGCIHYSSCRRFLIGSFERSCEPCGQSDSVSFICSAHVQLTGIRFCGSDESNYLVKLTIYKGESRNSGMLIYRNIDQSNFTTDSKKSEGYYGFTVKLEKPVCIEPGAPYTIEALVRGPKCYVSENGDDMHRGEHATFIFIKRKPKGIITELLYCKRLSLGDNALTTEAPFENVSIVATPRK